MALSDPVAAYDAAGSMDAYLARTALTAAGIEAFVTEDVSVVGMWVGGVIPAIHRPQVWVDRADIDRAKPILVEFIQRSVELRTADAEASATPVGELQSLHFTRA